MADLVDSIRGRYMRTIDAIAVSARKVGRDPESVRLVVVTKLQPVEVIEAALEAGVRILGENYAEEAVAKMQALGLGAPEAQERFPVQWHMIGHIQGRKARMVAEHFALVHSVDSLKLAQRLDRFAGELGLELPVLLEFNVGGEMGKEGWPASVDSLWPQLLPEVGTIVQLPRLKLRGLMTMPPLSADPESARIYFRRLRGLRDFLASRLPETDWTELSMGTSADYTVAVEEGATLVRIGQAILGPRPEVQKV
jgi:PLP dependent protein